ncbi:hypothetical protein LJC46_08815 [Desulfovibrio sp. OttesenSCG-928-G15]|nr:hypothetical protein [Desulfovibrio sp. OttesenSCG-928-G15]
MAGQNAPPVGPGRPGKTDRSGRQDKAGHSHRESYGPWPVRIGRSLALLYLLAYVVGYFNEVYALVRLTAPDVAAVSSEFFTWREYLYGLCSLFCVILLVARPAGRGLLIRFFSACVALLSLFPVLHLWFVAPKLAFAYLSWANYLLPLVYCAVSACFFRPEWAGCCASAIFRQFRERA